MSPDCPHAASCVCVFSNLSLKFYELTVCAHDPQRVSQTYSLGRNAIILNGEEPPPFIRGSLLPGCSLILECSVKTMLLRSRDGCLLFLMRVCRINGMPKSVCFNN